MGKRLTVRQKQINKAQRAIERAEKAMKKAQNIEAALRSAGTLATSYNTYSGTENLIKEVKDYIASGKRLSAGFKYKVSVLSERTENFWTAGIKFYPGTSVQRGKNYVPTNAIVTVKEAQRISNRYALKKTITKEEFDILTKFQTGINPVSNAAAMQHTPQELAEMRRKKKSMKEKDVSFGGDSTLINDLAYSANIEYARPFVEMIIDLMKDPLMFEQIETWYRENQDVQTTLDQATGTYWYEDFCDAKRTIIEFINKLQENFADKLSDDIKEKLKDYKDFLDNDGETVNENS